MSCENNEDNEGLADNLALNLFSNVFNTDDINFLPKTKLTLTVATRTNEAIPDYIIKFLGKKNAFIIVQDKTKEGDSFQKAEAQALAQLIALCQKYEYAGKLNYFIIIRGLLIRVYSATLSLNFIENVRKGVCCQEITIINSYQALSCAFFTSLKIICEILCGIEEHYKKCF